MDEVYVQDDGVIPTETWVEETLEEESKIIDFWGERGDSFTVVNDSEIHKTEYCSQTIYSKDVFNSHKYENKILRFNIKIIEKFGSLIIGFTNNNKYISDEFSDFNVNTSNEDIYYAIDGNSNMLYCSNDINNNNNKTGLKCSFNATFDTNDLIIVELNFYEKKIKFYNSNNNNKMETLFSDINADNVDYRLAVSCYNEQNKLLIEQYTVVDAIQTIDNTQNNNKSIAEASSSSIAGATQERGFDNENENMNTILDFIECDEKQLTSNVSNLRNTIKKLQINQNNVDYASKCWRFGLEMLRLAHTLDSNNKHTKETRFRIDKKEVFENYLLPKQPILFETTDTTDDSGEAGANTTIDEKTEFEVPSVIKDWTDTNASNKVSNISFDSKDSNDSFIRNYKLSRMLESNYSGALKAFETETKKIFFDKMVNSNDMNSINDKIKKEEETMQNQKNTNKNNDNSFVNELENNVNQRKSDILQNLEFFYPLFDQFNNLVQSKNSLMNKINILKSDLNRLNMKQTKLNEYHNTLNSKYNEINSDSLKQQINKLKQQRAIALNEFEKKWFDWNAKDISFWFEIKLIESGKNGQNGNNIDFSVLSSNLEKGKYVGKDISSMKSSDLKQLGIDSIAHQKFLSEEIENLTKRYPKLN